MAFTNDDLKWLESKNALKSNLGFYEIKINDDFSLFFGSCRNEDTYYCDLVYKNGIVKTKAGKTLFEALGNTIDSCLHDMDVCLKFIQIINNLLDIKYNDSRQTSNK